MDEPAKEDTVYYIKTDTPINENSVLEDDGSYLTPQNKIAPSKDETGSRNDLSKIEKSEDVQSDRIVIKLKCAVVVLMALVLFALMALAIHLASSHPHHFDGDEPHHDEKIKDGIMKNITVKTGNGFHLTYTSNKKVTYCSVNTPFDEEELERRAKESNANHTSRILIHDEQDEKNDVKSADNGRLLMTINENLCQITISKAMTKDDGRWDLFIGVGKEFFKRKNIIYMISIAGDDLIDTNPTTSQKTLHTTKEIMLETTQQEFHSSSDTQNLTLEPAISTSTISPTPLQTTFQITTSSSTLFSTNLPTLVSSKRVKNASKESLSTSVTTQENFTGTVTSNPTSTTNVTN